MKLLITTQKIDETDSVLGFFVRWVQEFSKHYDEVIVVCLEKGVFTLPSNVRVISLGKEQGGMYRLRAFVRFYKYIWGERKNYDTVFVHMNPIYVLLGGLLWRAWNKKISLWYTHRNVDLKLILAEKISHLIFSASKYSFGIETEKLNILGHGIEVDNFFCKDKRKNTPLEIMSIGRITEIKGGLIILKAAKILREKWGESFNISFVGSCATSQDEEYLLSMKEYISTNSLEEIVSFRGSVSADQIKGMYCEADLIINALPLGGLDKVVAEAMASGTPVLTSNKAFKKYFGEYAEELIFEESDPEDLAQKIINFYKGDKHSAVSLFLRKSAQDSFSLKNLVDNIQKKLCAQ